MKHDADYAEAGADYYDQRDQRNLEYLAQPATISRPSPGSATR